MSDGGNGYGFDVVRTQNTVGDSDLRMINVRQANVVVEVITD